MELTEFQQQIEELCLETPAPGLHCVRNAIHHLRKAWEIRSSDREMAAFRAITAEEESVTAIFHSLKRRNYEGADKLKPRNHVHKSALRPFFYAVGEVLDLSKEMGLDPAIQIDNKEKPGRLKIRLTIPFGEKKKWVYPDPPLHYTIQLNERIHTFEDQLSSIATEKNVRNIMTFLKSEANFRNQLLYASPTGIPSISGPVDVPLLKRRDFVFVNLAVYLMIDPYSQRQLFVQQALASFLKMLNLLPNEDAVFEQIFSEIRGV